jgi:hypothetical protein
MHGGRAFNGGGGGGSDDHAAEPSVRAGGALFGGGGGSGRSGGFFADLSTRGGSAFFSGGGGGGAGSTPARARADILVRLDLAVELGQLVPAGPGGSVRGGGTGGEGVGSGPSEAASTEGTAHGGPAQTPASWLDDDLRAALLATQEDAARMYAAASIGRSSSPVSGRKAARARATAAVVDGPLAAAVARLRAAEAAALLAATEIGNKGGDAPEGGGVTLVVEGAPGGGV